MFSQDLRDNDYIVEFDSDQERAESSDDEIGVILHGTPEQKRRLRRRSLGQDSSSEDDFEKEMEEELSATVKSLEDERKIPAISSAAAAQGSEVAMDTGQPSTSSKVKQPTTAANSFYDDMYFDSDEDEDKEKSGKSKNEKHRILSNDELLYDPKMDEEDQSWVDGQRRLYRDQAGQSQKSTPGGAVKKPRPSPSSDAVLNCPACMTTLCIDCQRHEIYKQQYRAMFVMNCQVDRTEMLAFPQQNKNKHKKSKKHKQAQNPQAETNNGPSQTDSEQFNPVRCTECTTEVGVYDTDEVYHFFNVIASYG